MPTLSRNYRRQYWLIRAYYFLFLGAFSCLTPFLGLFYRRQGLSGAQIGILGTIGALVGLVIAPNWTRWSDRLAHPRPLLQAAFLGSALGYLVLSQQASFNWIALLVGLIAVLLSGIEPVSDAMALRVAQEQENSRFGSIRLWGSLGWALVVYLAGWLVETRGIQAAFWGYTGFILLTVVVTQFLVPGDKSPHTPGTGNGHATWDVVAAVLRDRGLIALSISLALVWFVRSGLYQFQAIYMDQLGAAESLIGLVNTLSGLMELPSMLWADHLATRFGSHRLMGAGFLLFALSAATIVVLPRIPTFLLVGALSGVAFSFYNVALVVFVDERAPHGQTATVLALVMVTLRGLVQILAAPLSGLAYDRFGPYWLYVAATLGTLLGWALFRSLVSGVRSRVTKDL